MNNRNHFVKLASASALGMLAVAFVGVQMQPDEATAQPKVTNVDPAESYCKAMVTHQKEIVSAAIIDTRSGDVMLTRAFSGSSVAPSLATDVQHAINPKTGDSHGFFHVNFNGTIVESCDVGNARYQPEPAVK